MEPGTSKEAAGASSQTGQSLRIRSLTSFLPSNLGSTSPLGSTNSPGGRPQSGPFSVTGAGLNPAQDEEMVLPLNLQDLSRAMRAGSFSRLRRQTITKGKPWACQGPKPWSFSGSRLSGSMPAVASCSGVSEAFTRAPMSLAMPAFMAVSLALLCDALAVASSIFWAVSSSLARLGAKDAGSRVARQPNWSWNWRARASALSRVAMPPAITVWPMAANSSGSRGMTGVWPMALALALAMSLYTRLNFRSSRFTFWFTSGITGATGFMAATRLVCASRWYSRLFGASPMASVVR